jgi:hypothetical protein
MKAVLCKRHSTKKNLNYGKENQESRKLIEDERR